MVQINLLPPTIRSKQKRRVELEVKLEPLIFILIGTILAVIVVWVLLGVRLSAQRKVLARQDDQLKSLKFNLEKADKLEEEKTLFLRKLEIIHQQLKKQLLWARTLNRLSNLLPAGIWFKKITLDTVEVGGLKTNVGLDINAVAISLKGEEMIDLIGKFMTALKKDEVFSEQFSEIRLISSKRGEFGKIETMDFNLFCQFQ